MYQLCQRTNSKIIFQTSNKLKLVHLLEIELKHSIFDFELPTWDIKPIFRFTELLIKQTQPSIFRTSNIFWYSNSNNRSKVKVNKIGLQVGGMFFIPLFYEDYSYVLLNREETDEEQPGKNASSFVHKTLFTLDFFCVIFWQLALVVRYETHPSNAASNFS